MTPTRRSRDTSQDGSFLDENPGSDLSANQQGGDRDSSSNILNELITEARKFGVGMVLASQMSDHFSEEVRANAATWLVLKPMDVKEAKRNAPNVSVDPQDLLQLAGRGDGYYRDRPSSRARRIQVSSLGTLGPERD